MPKSKYETMVEPKLVLIEGWQEMGSLMNKYMIAK